MIVPERVMTVPERVMIVPEKVMTVPEKAMTVPRQTTVIEFRKPAFARGGPFACEIRGSGRYQQIPALQRKDAAERLRQ
jgi:hypothetical protein